MMRAGRAAPSRNAILLAGVLLFAAAVRLYGVGYGLPALYDVDEPMFVLTSLKLLLHRTLDPGWFGHPGSTTVYCLAVIELLIVGVGTLTGRFPNASAFGDAIYADPTVIFLPGRLFIVLCGVLCVVLTFLVARRLCGVRTGLIAAALLAIDPLHIEYSQIIRTDVHASVFMLLCALCSLRIVSGGRLRDYLLAAAAIGFAAATKWPAATIAICPVGACLLRAHRAPADAMRQFGYLAAAAVGSVAALFVASPFLLLDYHTVLADVGGEHQPDHLGATGGSFLANAGWYLTQPLRGAIGIAGLALAAIGVLAASLRNRSALAVPLAGAAMFFVVICAQTLIWPRWIVPLLPFVSIFMAIGVVGLGALAAAKLGSRWRLAAEMLVLLAVAGPMVLTAASQARERLHDTRGLASAWVRGHVPPGRSILIEHFAFDLLGQYPLRFPLGAAGCIDAAAVLKSKIPVSTVSALRNGSAIVNIGTINEARAGTCRSDFAILSYYDRYLAEPARYAREIAVYRRLFAKGRVVAVFNPVPGRIGGPVIRIVAMSPAR